MTRAPVSKILQDVEALLRERVTSHAELDTLLLLRGQPGLQWTPEAVAARLGCPTEVARDALASLDRNGLVEWRAEGFAYCPAGLEACVDRLASAWSETPLDVMKVLNVNALERVRTSAARALADAFVIRRRRRDG